ncbi:MAG: hypothetical protein ACK502_08150 [Alphaproteobacteria bacterium]
MAEETTLPAENLAAASALEKQLSANLSDASITITSKLRNSMTHPRGEPEIKEGLDITISHPSVTQTPLAVANAVKVVLAKLPALKDKVQFESDAEHANTMRKNLERMIAQGADVPKNYLEWGGFKPDVAEETGWGNSLKAHALDISKDNGGISVNMTLPLTRDEQPNSKALIEAAEANIKSRLPAIKALLAERLAKYKNVTDAAGRATIKEQVDKLTFQISSHEYNKQDRMSIPAQVNITIMSPVQAQEVQDPPKFYGKPEEEKRKIAATNPLDSLTIEQLGKSLGRSFLHAGDTANELFPKIAGREDMKRAVIKSLVRLKKAKPELAKDVDSFIADDTFKDTDNWGKPKGQQVEAKGRPEVSTDKDGKLHISMDLPAGQAYEVIKSLAGMDAPKQQATMAKVEETAVGAITPSMQEKALAAAIDQVLSAYQPAGQSR